MIGVVGQCGPGFLTIDDVLVTHALRTGLERSQVGAGTRLGVTLAPPILNGDDAGQVFGFLGLATKLHQHRADHGQAKRQEPGRTSLEGLDFKNQALNRRPACATIFLGPVGRTPAAFGEQSVPADVILFLQSLVAKGLFAQVSWKLLAQKGANLIAKRNLFRIPGQIHEFILLLMRQSSSPGSGGKSRILEASIQLD